MLASEVPRSLPLEFLLIGAQKCATSWLYLCLAEHPEMSALPEVRRLVGAPKAAEQTELERLLAELPPANRPQGAMPL